MRRSLARFSGPASLIHAPSLADSIATTPEFRFFGPHRLGRLHAQGCCCLDTGTPSPNSCPPIGQERKREMFWIKMPITLNVK